MNKMIFLIVLSALLSCNTKLLSQQTALPDAKLYFAAVYVKNVDTSIAWYSKVLNLKLRNRTDNKERGFKQVNLENSDVLIELVELNNTILRNSIIEAAPKGSAINGYSKIGFRIGKIDDWYKRLKNLNVNFLGSIVQDYSGKKMFIIKDPDENLIQFFEE